MNEDVWMGAEHTLRIVGAGAYVAPHVVTNEQITRAFPGWSPEKLGEKTGVSERRFLWPLDLDRGCAVSAEAQGAMITTATDMGEKALSDALSMAGVTAKELDILVVVTCTPDQPHFSHDAMELHRRLGGRAGAHCLVVDSGCGGSLYVVDMLARMMSNGPLRTAAVVGTHLTSRVVDRGVYTKDGIIGEDGERVQPYLSTYLFGDGAGAIVLRRERGRRGIRTSVAGNEYWELVRSPGGGTDSPSYGDRYNAVDHAFIVNGRLVAKTYMKTMQACIETVARRAQRSLPDIERFYLHQPNARMLQLLARSLGLRDDQLASNVAHNGNTSSAGMFTLLADDLHKGRLELGTGAPVIFAAIGAGVHYGAQVVEL